MRKVMVVVINRANYARIKSALIAIRKHKDLQLKIVAGASMLLGRFGEAVNVMIEDGFRVDGEIRVTLEGENTVTMAKSTGIALLELPTLFEHHKPDMVVTIADRYETLGTAIAASYMNIPLVHTQGGEISGSIDHSVRNAITKLSHVHLATNSVCADRLKRMGESSKRIFVTGCPSMDIAKAVAKDPDKYIKKYRKSHNLNIDTDKPFLLMMQHPVTTKWEDAAAEMEETINALVRLKMPTIALYPNVDAGSYHMVKKIQHLGVEKLPFFSFYKNFSPEVFLALLKKTSCIIGNSSAGIRESSFYGTPSVSIGTRQQNRDRGENVLNAGYSKNAIFKAINKQLDHGSYRPSRLYGDGMAGERIADILARCDLDIIK
jgi:UDP-hydrolysing UDP-N-acetyl-D-glucosamine 2-epimerase